MSYINIDKALESIELIAKNDSEKFDKDSARYAIQTTPTEDVVPVVRKSVKGYEGYYEVDQFGRVFSVDRVISVNDSGRQYNKPLKAKQMKQHILP